MKKKVFTLPILSLLLCLPFSQKTINLEFGKQIKKAASQLGVKTLIIDGSTLTSTATSDSSTKTYTDDKENNIEISFSDGAKSQSSTGNNKFSSSAILIGKSGKNIHNLTSLGKIKTFQIYANKGASAKVSVGVNFSSSVINSYNENANNTWTETLSTLDHVYDCASALPTDASFFYYQVTNSNNSQVEFKITYETHFTVSFEGEGVDPSSAEIQYKNKILDSQKPSNPHRDGFQFLGWYRKDNQGNFTTEWNFSEDIVTENTTLYAKWQESDAVEHLVSFEIDGNEVGFQDLYDGASITRPEDPVISGKKFLGWYEDEGCTIEYVFPKVLTSEDPSIIVIYGKVRDLYNYTVTFYNGSVVFDSVNVIEDSAVDKPANNPTKASDSTYNYTFETWCTDSELTNEYKFSELVTSSFPLYARYTRTKISEDKIAETTTKVKLSYSYALDYSAEESVDFSEQDYENQEIVEEYSGSIFTINFNKGTNNNDPKYFDSGKAIRIYGGGYFTVRSEKTMKKIEFTFASGEGSNEISSSTGTFSDCIWKGSSTNVTFSIGGTSGHRRIASVKVTYESDTPNGKYIFSDINLNFGAILTQAHYNDIFEGVSTKKIGVAFARTSKLTADSKTIEEALTKNATYIGKTEVDPAVTSPFTTDENGVLDVNGTHYSWSVSLAVPTLDANSDYTEAFLTESITAVAYMYAENHYVFFGERAMSVAQAAEAYKTHPVYTGGTDMTRATLDYLAALDD